MTRKKVHFDDEIIIRGTTYWYRGTPAGSKQRIERSLHVEVGAPQKLVLIAKKDFLESMEFLGSTPGSTYFKNIAIRYVAFKKEEQLAKKTIFEIENIIKQLMPFFRKYRLEDINQPLFNEYCKTKPDVSLVPHRKILNQLLKWSRQHGHTRYLMAVDIPKFAKKMKRQREVMSHDQVLKLLKNLDGLALLYFSMYALMGIRNKESILLKWENIDFEKRALRIVPESNKNRRGRVVPINSHVLALLQFASKDDSPWVFPGLRGGHMDHSKPFRAHWARALKAVAPDRHFTPHDLRAFFETEMNTLPGYTDTQREKMAGAKIDVQKRDYVTMNVEHLRGLEESVQIKGLAEIFDKKIGAKRGAKSEFQDGDK